MSQNPEHDELIRSYVSWLLAVPKEYQRPVEKLCPACGAKHIGFFQHSNQCQDALSRGE